MISIIIPTLNEEKNLPVVLKDVKAEMEKRDRDYEIVIVDGHSKDGTVEIAKQHGCKIIYDDIGKGSALQKGMKEVIGDVVIMMDADCSHRSIELGLLIEAIESGYDIAMGSRFIQGGGSEDITWLRVLGNKLFVFLVNLFWKMNYTDLCYGYRAFSSSSMKQLELESEGFGIETEISIKSAKQRMNVVEIPSFEKARAEGEGNLDTFKDGRRILRRILKELKN